MASRIVSLVRSRRVATPTPRPSSRPSSQPISLGLPERAPAHGPTHRPTHKHAWRGASGRLYAHDVYGLIECPPLPATSYVLVRRDAQGRRTALRVGVGTSDAPTLNLAQIRQQGAQAGANEVHVRLLGATSDVEHRLAACDLRAGLFGTLAAEADPDQAPADGA